MDANKLSEYLFKIDRPCVFKGILKSDGAINSCSSWTPENLARIFGPEKFTFRIGNKSSDRSNTQFENQCEYIDADLGEFVDWVTRKDSERGKKPKLDQSPFDGYNADEFWAYADYKYMIELLKPDSSIEKRCIDWRSFGFVGRDASQSTLWIGSEGAYTPCHFDTYGYNLVAQIYGKKKWVMFPKTDSEFMYPTRVPFEESTVYSKVNIKSPDIQKYPLFKLVNPYVVELNPGDVLYVPKNWWHFVENLETSISINTWVELEAHDNYSRLKEIISKIVLQGLMDSNMVEFENWINSSENYSPQDENMEMLKKCIDVLRTQQGIEPDSGLDYEEMVVKHESFSKFVGSVSFDEYFKNSRIDLGHSSIEIDYLVELSNAATQPNVVELITKNLLQNLRIDSNFK